jgi:two-component system chemotaxis sensor kinase CheA
MDNGMDNMLDMYLFETNSLLEQLDELLIEAEKNEEFTTDDVNEIFRAMHTIKGSSAMMEFNSLMTIAHRIEDLFFFVRENGIDSLNSTDKSELFNLTFKSTDVLRGEVEKLENNEPLTTNIDSITSEINSFLNKISGTEEAEAPVQEETPEVKAPGGSESAQKLVESLGSKCPFFLQIFFDEGCGMENLRAFMLVNALHGTELEFEFYPEDVESNGATSEAIIDHGFFVGLHTEEDVTKAIAVVEEQGSIQTYEVIHPEVKKQEEPAKEASAPKATVPVAEPVKGSTQPAGKEATGAQSQHAKQSLLSVNLSKLDALQAIVGEIVITESMVASSPELQGLKLDTFLKNTRQLRKLTDDLQDISMSLRMVSISGTFQKMNRIVRDMKKALNKDVRLTIIGEDTEIDKTIVDSISDPIMHIVRNSMDHGIETTKEERIAAGKDPQGELILSASHTGSEVIISVSDDGQGMDTEKILAKAARNGLLTKPESEYSKKEILSLLMLPGFSTNEEVTEFSGRGVGMDVVKKNVESVGGTISITSELGQGSCTTLKIPLTMAIVDGMEIRVGKTIFTIPISNIRQSIKIARENVLHDAKGNEIVKIMDEFYPIIRLHEFYNIEPEVTQIEDGILIWVEAGDHSYCMFVDELLGERQIVVKPLPSYLNSFNIKDYGISGCTILGDGNISIILEVMNLYNAANV